MKQPHWLDRSITSRIGGVALRFVFLAVLACPACDATKSAVTTTSTETALDVASSTRESRTPERTSSVAARHEDSGPLLHFFRALATLEAGESRRARIVWLGDSHTAADFMTGPLRSTLQTRFGDAGPGFVPLSLLHVRNVAVATKRDGAWNCDPGSPASSRQQLDGMFGLAGQRCTASSGASVTGSFFRATSTDLGWEIVFRFPSRRGEFEVAAGTTKPALVRAPNSASKGDVRERRSSLLSYGFDASGSESVRIRVTEGPVQLFGAFVEASSPGLVLDAFGINGARSNTPMGWDESGLVGELEERQPDMLVLAYGTNEASDTVDLQRYRDAYVRLVSIVNGFPKGTSCLLFGPTARRDPVAQQRTAAVDAFQRATATELGCAYVSVLSLMGGDDGFLAWARNKPALASKDGVHLTKAGYERLAELFGQRLLDGYGAWSRGQATASLAGAP